MNIYRTLSLTNKICHRRVISQGSFLVISSLYFRVCDKNAVDDFSKNSRLHLESLSNCQVTKLLFIKATLSTNNARHKSVEIEDLFARLIKVPEKRDN